MSLDSFQCDPTSSIGARASSVFGPIPRTCRSSSGLANGPFVSRYSIIRAESDDPIFGSARSSAAVARFKSTTNRGGESGSTSRSRRQSTRLVPSNSRNPMRSDHPIQTLNTGCGCIPDPAIPAGPELPISSSALEFALHIRIRPFLKHLPTNYSSIVGLACPWQGGRHHRWSLR